MSAWLRVRVASWLRGSMHAWLRACVAACVRGCVAECVRAGRGGRGRGYVRCGLGVWPVSYTISTLSCPRADGGIEDGAGVWVGI